LHPCFSQQRTPFATRTEFIYILEAPGNQY
jgi:hypothetical protein